MGNRHVELQLDLVGMKLDQVLRKLNQLLQGEKAMSKELDDLKAQVKANTDIEASAVTLIQGLAAQIESLKTDPAALTQLAADLKTQADALSAAITANTTP